MCTATLVQASRVSGRQNGVCSGEVPAVIDNLSMIRRGKCTFGHRQEAVDLAFWLSRPMAERIAAVEALRQSNVAGDDSREAEPRIQRVCRVVHRTKR